MDEAIEKISLSDRQHRRMTSAPMHKLIMSLAFPAVIGQLITVIYNTADTWFVSQINTSATAAVGVVFALMTVIQALGFGIGMGAGSLTSMKLGEKKKDEAQKYASSAFLCAFLIGLLICIFGLIFLDPLMRILGSTDTVLPYSRDYAKFILIGTPFLCSSFLLSTIMRSEGEATLSTLGLSAGSIINVGLDALFIYVFDMGITGAALATAISQFISFLILLIMFMSGKSIVKIKLSSVSRNFNDYRLIISTGFPTICRQGLASIASASLNLQAAFYGDATLAAITIANRIYMLVRTIILGIGMGFQPAAGYNYGANNFKRTKSAFWWACIYGTIICFSAGVIISIFPSEIMSWFRNDDAVVQIGSKALLFACAVMPFMAYSTFVNQLYQCLGYKVQATILASLRQGIFFLPLVFTLPTVFGVLGVQMAQPGADILTFVISVPFQIYFSKNHR